MEQIIKRFQEQLKTNVPTLAEVAEDYGQCEFYAERPPVKFPCALIDVQDAAYSDTGGNRQHGTLTVVVKLYILNLATSNPAADATVKGWQCCNNIIKALHGQDFIKNGFATPRRVRLQRIKRRDGIYERDITFTVGFVDTSTMPEHKKVRPTIKINGD